MLLQAGKPLFVSLVLYLNPEWDAAWNAETLFLDPDTSTGVFVQPRAGRLVLLEQDAVHRIAVPSLDAPECRFACLCSLCRTCTAQVSFSGV